jgi:hypothetical protein
MKAHKLLEIVWLILGFLGSMDKKLDFRVNDKRTAFGCFDPGRCNDS